MGLATTRAFARRGANMVLAARRTRWRHLPTRWPPAGGRLAGRLGHRFFLDAAPPAPASDGALFAPVPDTLEVRGG